MWVKQQIITVMKQYLKITDCISEKENPPIDNAKDTDAVMSMYNFLKKY